MSGQVKITSANETLITLEDGTSFNPRTYINNLKLYDNNGNTINNLDKFYENGKFISKAAPLLLGLYVKSEDVKMGEGVSRRKNYKKSVRRVKSAKRASRSRSRKYRNRK